MNLNVENIKNILKLPIASFRNKFFNGSLAGGFGLIWSTDTFTNKNGAYAFEYNYGLEDIVSRNGYNFTDGIPVRCIGN